MPLDRGAQRLLKMLAMAGQNSGATRTPAARRRTLSSLAQTVDTAPAEPVNTQELALPGPSGELLARLYRPEADGDAADAGLILYLHGGGGVAGGLDTHDGLCRRLSVGAGFPVMAVAYRLAPEHPFPAALDDAFAATRWIAANAATLGLDATRLVIAGDSAGASLAAVVAQSADRPPIALQLLICPILNVASETASRREFADGYFVDSGTLAADVEDYAQGCDLSDPRLSPLLTAKLEGAPPALIHTAEYDPFRDEGEAYAARLVEAGVRASLTRHEGMIHYFYCMPRAIPYAADALSAIGRQIREALTA
jgi:acetyl esterase/lipase